MVLLGMPVTTVADDPPVAQSMYRNATKAPDLEAGEALSSLDGVQLEVSVFAPGAASPSAIRYPPC